MATVTFEKITSTLTLGTLGSAALNYRNFDRKHKPMNIVSSERYIIHMQVLLEKCCYI